MDGGACEIWGTWARFYAVSRIRQCFHSPPERHGIPWGVSWMHGPHDSHPRLLSHLRCRRATLCQPERRRRIGSNPLPRTRPQVAKPPRHDRRGMGHAKHAESGRDARTPRFGILSHSTGTPRQDPAPPGRSITLAAPQGRVNPWRPQADHRRGALRARQLPHSNSRPRQGPRR